MSAASTNHDLQSVTPFAELLDQRARIGLVSETPLRQLQRSRITSRITAQGITPRQLQSHHEHQYLEETYGERE